MKIFTNQEIANDLAKIFSKISQEFTPLSDNLLPSRVRNNLESESEIIPTIEPYIVYEKIKEMNIPDLVFPGDFPPRIWKLFAVELSGPVSIIANKILRSGEWPVE